MTPVASATATPPSAEPTTAAPPSGAPASRALPAPRASREAPPLLLYDGECGFCSRSVQALLDLDPGGTLRFAPLQGPAAAPILVRQRIRPHPTRGWESLVFVRDPGGAREAAASYSAAVLAICAYLGGAYRALGLVGLLVPLPLRDAAYTLVARNRQRLGANTTCRVPRPDERRRLLA